jgi:hypothetical protein
VIARLFNETIRRRGLLVFVVGQNCQDLEILASFQERRHHVNIAFFCNLLCIFQQTACRGYPIAQMSLISPHQWASCRRFPTQLFFATSTSNVATRSDGALAAASSKSMGSATQAPSGVDCGISPCARQKYQSVPAALRRETIAQVFAPHIRLEEYLSTSFGELRLPRQEQQVRGRTFLQQLHRTSCLVQ